MSNLATAAHLRAAVSQFPASWYCDPRVFELEQRLLFPRARPLANALVVAALLVGNELFQLVHAPWLEELRETLFGRVVLGSRYNPLDLVAIVGGVALATLLDAELAFGLHPLLDRASLTVLEGDRIGLIGRNGTGKSSLLNVIAGRVALDDGELKKRDGLSVAMVEQEPDIPPASSLRESLALRGHLERLADERERWRIEARLVTERPLTGEEEGRLRELVQSRLPARFEISFVYCDAIARSAGGKYEDFLSEVAPAGRGQSTYGSR